jgi:hypothetical protein
VAWAGVRGRAVSRLSAGTRPSLAFRTFPSCCSPSPAAAPRSRCAGRVPGSLESRHTASHLGLAFGVLAEPSRTAHLAVRGPPSPGTSSLVGWPISRWPRERPLPEDESSFGRRLPHRRSRSALVVSHHLDGFRRSRLPACCSRYRVWVRQVSVGSVVGAKAPRAGSVVPAGAPPCEGLFLVGSRTASLRPVLHRRIRVPRRRCRRCVTRSFLGLVSPSRHGHHRRWCLRSPEDPIPLPVAPWSRSRLRGCDGRPKVSVRWWELRPSPVTASLGFSTSKSCCCELKFAASSLRTRLSPLRRS